MSPNSLARELPDEQVRKLLREEPGKVPAEFGNPLATFRPSAGVSADTRRDRWGRLDGPLVVAVVGKGGDGKTSCTGLIGGALAELTGWDVVLVDADPQRSLSDWLAPQSIDVLAVDDVLVGGATVGEVLVDVAEGVRLAPVSTALADVEGGLDRSAVGERLFVPLRGAADVVLVDTYASRPLGDSARVLAGVLDACDAVLVPFRPTTNSLRALRHTLAAVRAHEEVEGRRLPVWLLPSAVVRAVEGDASIGALQAVGWEPLPRIRSSVSVGKAQAAGELLHDGSGHRAQVVRGDYLAAAVEVATRLVQLDDDPSSPADADGGR